MRRDDSVSCSTFLAGVLAAAVAGVLAGSAGSLAATRYEDLSRLHAAC